MVAAFVFFVVIFVPVIAVAAAVPVIVVFVGVAFGPDAGIVVPPGFILRIIRHIRVFAAAAAVLVALRVIVMIPDIVYGIGAVIGAMTMAVANVVRASGFVPGPR